MKISRRNFLKALGTGGLALLGCRTNENEINTLQPVIRRISYKLEDLCDTKIYWRDIKVHVYVEPSELLWEHHKYREEIFSHISGFFRENNINCRVVYSKKQLNKFNSANEFGIEILDSEKEKEDRYWQLSTGIQEIPENNALSLHKTSYAVTNAQVVLTYGRRYSETGKSQEEIDKIVAELYKKNKEFVLRNHASHFAHEILHCMSLFHTDTFIPSPIEETEIPNIMLKKIPLRTPQPTKQHSLGYCLSPLQQKLIHSFIAWNNNYRAFLDSKKDLVLYIENLAEANSLKFKFK